MGKLTFETSKSGAACLWEQGGANTNTGTAWIISNMDGTKPQAIYIPKSGHLSCGNHALIPVSIGQYIVLASQWRGEFDIEVWKITAIDYPNGFVTTELFAKCTDDNWDTSLTIPYFLKDAITAASDKASCYHCRRPYFVLEPKYRKKEA